MNSHLSSRSRTHRYRPFWIRISDDADFMPTDTQFRRFIVALGTGLDPLDRSTTVLRASFHDLQQGLLAVAFGSLGAPSAFRKVGVKPHGDPRNVPRRALSMWFGDAWATHVADRFHAYVIMGVVMCSAAH
jgi:hypothetical protein